MNEEFSESVGLSGESSESDYGITDLVSYDDRGNVVSVSSGDAGSSGTDLSGFDYDQFAEILSDTFLYTVSGGDYCNFDPVVQQEIYAEIATLNTYVRNLSALVSLILAFLLLDWTGRKLLTTVKRFTGKR